MSIKIEDLPTVYDAQNTEREIYKIFINFGKKTNFLRQMQKA